MTLLWCKAVQDDLGGSQTILTSPNGAVRPKYEFTRKFKARSNSKFDDAETVREQAFVLGLPALFSSHPNNPTALLQSIEPRLTDPPYLWTIDLKYSSDVGDPAKFDDSPLNRPTDITFGFQKYQRPITQDVNGLPVVNSAGEAFDPAIEIDDSRPTMTFARNEGGFDPQLPLIYQDAVNSDAFFGFLPGQVKISNIQSVFANEGSVTFWRVTYEFEVRREGWRLRVLDQGTRYLDLTTNERRELTDGKTGLAVSKPVLLDGDGLPLYPGFSGQTGAKTTLSAAIDNITTLVGVAADNVFGIDPAFDQEGLFVRIDDEVMEVTEVHVGGNQLLRVLRGQQGTTAASHLNAAIVQQEPVYLEYQAYKELPFAVLNLP